MAGGVVALVALGLDDHPADAVDEQLAADQLARDLVHRAVEEVGAEDGHPPPAPSSASTARARSSCSPRRAAEVPPAEQLRVEPGALAQDLVVLVVEQLGVLGELLAVELGERAAGVERRAHEPADDAVGLAERHPLADQQVGDVGGGDHLVGGRGGEPLAVEAQAGEQPLGRLEAELDRVDGVEQRLLVLLQVLGVGERERVQDAGERRQRAGDPRRLRAQQLGRVGVLLLRHQARAGGEVVGGLAEAELAARPDHDLRAEPRQVRRADRRRVHVVEREVAVGDGVDRVRRRAREAELVRRRLAVEVPVEARERTRAERHRAASSGGRSRSGSRRARASRSRRAGGGPGTPAGRAAGGCSPASASRDAPRRAPAAAPSARRPAPPRGPRAARTNSARSVATWSLRERPVCSLPPTGPASSVSRRSIAMWMSSSSSRSSNSPRSSSAGDRVEAGEQSVALARVEDPRPDAGRRRAPASPRRPRARAARSKPIEALRRANSGSCGSSKRGMAP